MLNCDNNPIKTIKDRRLAYLVALQGCIDTLHYPTRLHSMEGKLGVYNKGTIVPVEPMEKYKTWID